MICKYLVVAGFLFFILSACEDENENETKISRNNTSDSHYLGENCMSCHVAGGDGEGWFTAAGSVFNNTKTTAYPNGSVKLTTEPNGMGALIKTIEVDSKGNFYTTEPIDWAGGLYVGVSGTKGEQSFMTSKISSGACSSCHGNSTDNVWVE